MINEENNNTSLVKNTTGDTASLSQLTDITEAFSGEDFMKITSEEYEKNPLAGKMMAILYAGSVKKQKESEEKIYDLMAQVKFYQALPTANIGYVMMNIIGTIVVGIGVSLNLNVWLIVLGGLLVIGGNGLPLLYLRNGKK